MAADSSGKHGAAPHAADAAEHSRLHRELAARERELSAIFENVPGILFYVAIEPGGEFRFLSMSQTGLAATGVPRERFVGALVRDVIPPASRDLVLENYREAIRSGRTVRWQEVSVYPAGQKIGEVAVTPIYDARGVATHLIGLVHDITDRERLEEAFRALRDEAHNRELKILLETSAQGVVSVDAQGTIATANRALETMFGWKRGELIGRPVEVLVPDGFREWHKHHREDYFAAPHPRLMGGGLHLLGKRKDGSTVSIEVSLNHVATPAGNVHAFAFVTDVTERQQRTAELEHRTAQLSRLASDLTLAEHHAREQIAKTLHDGVQQLLVSASLGLERRMRRDAQQSAGTDDLLAQVKDDLTNAIDAARSLSFELFPPVLHSSGLPAALRWLANQTRSKYGLEVDVTADPLANPGRRDVRTLLFESVRELLFNAVKHAQVDRVSVDLALDSDDQLCIAVQDRGVGFDPAALIDRGKDGQAGWGLFSIRERLTLLGGRLDVESAPAQGTRFRLVAPRGTAQADASGQEAVRGAAAGPPSSAGTSVPRTLRILIVDDHVPVRRVLRDLLEERKELSVVGDASDGLEAIAQARALQPDVILMDISMPRMDGVEATRRIRAELPSIEILGLSMQPRTQTPHAIEQAGAAGFFMKGTETQRLIDLLLVMQRTIALRPLDG